MVGRPGGAGIHEPEVGETGLRVLQDALIQKKNGLAGCADLGPCLRFFFCFPVVCTRLSIYCVCGDGSFSFRAMHMTQTGTLLDGREPWYPGLF